MVRAPHTGSSGSWPYSTCQKPLQTRVWQFRIWVTRPLKQGNATRRPGLLRSGIRPLCEHRVDQAVFHGFLGVHEVVAVAVQRDALDGLAGVLGQDLVQPLLHVQDLASVDVYVGGLALEPTARLM